MNNAKSARWKFIPWEDIKDIEFISMAGQEVMGIVIWDEAKYTKDLPLYRRFMAKHDKFFSDSLIQISLQIAQETAVEIENGIKTLLAQAPRNADKCRAG